ncbi:MAG: ComF family protein [Lachnospiraceae bacterium]|nr:ComF family protein [Lachnospiraceae bacterium]
MESRVLDLLYPPRCPVCDGLVPIRAPRCHPACRTKLTPVGTDTCMRCGKPVPEGAAEYCFDCSSKGESSFERGVSVFLYEGDIRDSMVCFKFHRREEYAAWYAEELLAAQGTALRGFAADAVIPVPIHRRKMRHRGYNQAERIARNLADGLELPMYADYLRRNRFTVPQKELSNHERVRNLMRALERGPQAEWLRKQHKTPRRVILVDDIYTTGSTMEACSAVLRSTGVEHVMVATICIGGGYV